MVMIFVGGVVLMFDGLTIGESNRGYWHVVMDYYNECVSRYNDVLKVKICTKTFLHGKQPKSEEDDVDCMVAENRPPDKSPNDNANQLSLSVVHGTGLSFAPKCGNF